MKKMKPDRFRSLNGDSEDRFARDGDVLRITRGNEDAGTIAERAANGFWPTKDFDVACTADVTNRTGVSGSHAAGSGINGRSEAQEDGVALTILRERISNCENQRPK